MRSLAHVLADICSASTHVRFTPSSDHKSGHLPRVMSALPLKADMCGAVAALLRPSVLGLMTSSSFTTCCTSKSAGFLKDSAAIYAGLAERVGKSLAVAVQAAGRGPFAALINRGNVLHDN